MRSALALIEAEIRRLRVELGGLHDESAWTESPPTRWSYHDRSLYWHVVFGREVLEPDIDVELTSRALIVRGRPLRRSSRVIEAILPVPQFFDCERPKILYRAGYLEITLPRRRRADG